MANGASGSALVAAINLHARGKSSGRGCDDVGHISTMPELAISRSPSRSKDSTCKPSPANTNTAARGGVQGRHRTAQEDAAGDECHRGQNRQRPAQSIGVVPFRLVVVAGEYHDEPACCAEQSQCADQAGRQRIDVNDNTFARAEPR